MSGVVQGSTSTQPQHYFGFPSTSSTSTSTSTVTFGGIVPSDTTINAAVAQPMYESEEEEEDELDSTNDQSRQDGEEGDYSSEEETLMNRAAREKKLGQAVDGLFGKEEVLPEEEFGAITVKELYDLLKSDTINLNPSYQRGVIWPEDRGPSLIASIFLNMHVPELLFNVYTETLLYPDLAEEPPLELIPKSQLADPSKFKVSRVGFPVAGDGLDKGKGKEKDELVRKMVWNCADGKQRCTAIRRFIDGEFSIEGLNGKRYHYSKLPPSARQTFDNKLIRFGYFRELHHNQEREVFRRVQQGVPLRSQETANAIDTEWKHWIDTLTTRFAPQEPEKQIQDPTVFSPRVIELGKRHKSLGVFCGLAGYLLREYDSAVYRAPSTRELDLKIVDAPTESKRAMIDAILSRFQRLTLVPQLSEDSKLYKWPSSVTKSSKNPKNFMAFPHRVWQRPVKAKGPRTGALAPVEFMFYPLVVQKWEGLRDGDLLEIVEKCRDVVWKAFPGEVKDNSKVWNTMRRFIDNFNPKTDLEQIYNDDGTRVGPQGRKKPLPPSSSSSLRRLHGSQSPSSNPSPAAIARITTPVATPNSATTTNQKPPSSTSKKRSNTDSTHSSMNLVSSRESNGAAAVPTPPPLKKQKKDKESSSNGSSSSSSSSKLKESVDKQRKKEAEEASKREREERDEGVRREKERAEEDIRREKEKRKEEARRAKEKADEEIKRESEKRAERRRREEEEQKAAEEKERKRKDRVERENRELLRRLTEEEVVSPRRRGGGQIQQEMAEGEDVKPVIRDASEPIMPFSSNASASPGRPRLPPLSNEAPSGRRTITTAGRDAIRDYIKSEPQDDSTASLGGSRPFATSNSQQPTTFKSIKQKLAAQVLTTQHRLPSVAAPRPVQRLLPVAPVSRLPPPRKRPTNGDEVNAIRYDERGRIVRQENMPPPMDAVEDEYERYGGRGEGDLVIGGEDYGMDGFESNGDHRGGGGGGERNDGLTEEQRKDQEVWSMLNSKRSNGNGSGGSTPAGRGVGGGRGDGRNPASNGPRIKKDPDAVDSHQSWRNDFERHRDSSRNRNDRSSHRDRSPANRDYGRPSSSNSHRNEAYFSDLTSRSFNNDRDSRGTAAEPRRSSGIAATVQYPNMPDYLPARPSSRQSNHNPRR